MTVKPHSMAKAVQWEIAKGHLRALVAIDGAMSSSLPPPYRFELTHMAVENFIRAFEADGFHEGVD